MGVPVNRAVRSMREEVGKLDFSVLLKVADGMAEGLLVGRRRHVNLVAQAFIDPHNIALRAG